MTGGLSDLIKILLVDDDKTIQTLYDRALGAAVYDKRFAGNGGEAMEFYQDWHPDIMVLDLMMPVMSGFEVLREIRTIRNDQTTKIVIATSLDDRKDVQVCIDFGIHGYIIKPFKPKELCDQLDIVRHFQAHGERRP